MSSGPRHQLSETLIGLLWGPRQCKGNDKGMSNAFCQISRHQPCTMPEEGGWLEEEGLCVDFWGLFTTNVVCGRPS